jgi:hypothetical protein
MARFARDCLTKMNDLTKRLEVTLGPDTADLTLRIGLHSGPVTAGVLRGDKSRFQLFGDCINTTSRIESTGQPNRIHVSSVTADFLSEAGKNHWLQEREDLVTAKGKGKLKTFWLQLRGVAAANTSTSSGASSSVTDGERNGFEDRMYQGGQLKEVPLRCLDSKEERLISWNVETLLGLLRNIAAKRQDNCLGPEMEAQLSVFESAELETMTTPFEEVKTVISLPTNGTRLERDLSPDDIILSDQVIGQVNDYVRTSK